MSGIYANWIKPQYPNMNNDIPQMRSEGFQPRLYLGSNVPYELGIKTTSGTGFKIDEKPQHQGVSRQITGYNNASRIFKPRHIKEVI